MSTSTPWGYVINDETPPDMLTPIELDDLTAGKFKGDERVAPNIQAACSAIRNYCGWHISPEASCTFSESILNCNGGIKWAGPDLLVQLPTTHLTEVTSVEIGGTLYTDYATETNGLIRLFDVPGRYMDRRTRITVQYIAGFAKEMIPDVRELIAHRVTHALVSPNGVQSESAGGVSITYSANWINSARATALAGDNKEVLLPYKVQGVY